MKASGLNPRQRDDTRLRSRVNWVTLAGVTFYLLFATASHAGHQAGHWSWQGSLGPGNGICLWYTSTGACSGWNYWLNSYGQSACFNSARLHVGFQNGDRIRGRYIDPCQSTALFPETVGMGGYLMAGTVDTEPGLQEYVPLAEAFT